MQSQNPFKKKRKPYEYQGEMVMQTPKNPYSPSRGKSRMLSGSGYASSSGPYQAQVGDPYGDRFDRSETNTKFEQTIEDIIAKINSGRMDGRSGEQMISRLRKDQQKAKGDYVRNAYKMRPQNPAMAQARSRMKPSYTIAPYDARTGRKLSTTELNNFKQQQEALYNRMGSDIPDFTFQSLNY